MSQIITLPMRQTNAFEYSHNTYKLIGRIIFEQTNRLEKIDTYDFLTSMECLHRYIREKRTQIYIMLGSGHASCRLTHTEVKDWHSIFPATKTFVVSFQPCHISIEIFDGIPEYGMDRPQG